jgi:hypothetical protein
MKRIPLLPNIYKKIGWISLPFTLAFGIAVYYFEFEISGFVIDYPPISDGFLSDLPSGNNLTNEVALSLFLISLFFISFSKEKHEDEFVNHVRLTSLQWAVIFNTVILFVANWIVYDFAYISVMMYNMFSTLIFYIVRFNILLYRTKHEQ